MTKEALDEMLEAIVQTGNEISDVLFITGRPVQVDILGELKPYKGKHAENILTSEVIGQVSKVVIGDSPRMLADLKEHGSCDCGYSLKNAARFRANVYYENGNNAMVMRYLKPAVPTFEGLKLGPTFYEIIKEKTGIVFVTGGTGVGKTTTIAAMLNEINKTREVHILTLEDPVEFLHTPIKATFSQREFGRDFYNFQRGMRAGMRQAPKIIFIGEIRDRETMEIVLNAGETGHLVLCTLHTSSAATTINRVIGMFTTDEEQQIRARLSGSMRYIVSQRLVPAIAGGRYLATEIMGSSLRTREAIELGESESRRLDEIIEAGNVQGWHSFEQVLSKAYEQNIITKETAMQYASNKSKMVQRLDSLVHQKGRKEAPSPTVKGLKMEG
jgi:twitching motility protein PilT